MRIRSVVAGAMAFSAALVAPGAAQAAVIDYNLFVLNNITVPGGDTEGRVAVGGNASLTSYSVGNLAPSNSANLVVRGNLTGNGGSAKGTTIVGGTATLSGSNGTFTTMLAPSGTPLPVDFTAEAAYLTQRAIELSGMASTGTVGTVPWGGQFTLNASTSGLNIFNITAAQLATSNTFTINMASGANVLINVSGASASFTGGLNVVGGSASNILWNFYDATALQIQSIDMKGSVLAAKADFTGAGGQMHGTLIVNNFSGKWGTSLEMHADAPYTGGLLTPPITTAVPEPASWAMMIGGFGLLGAALRRRAARAPVLV